MQILKGKQTKVYFVYVSNRKRYVNVLRPNPKNGFILSSGRSGMWHFLKRSVIGSLIHARLLLFLLLVLSS